MLSNLLIVLPIFALVLIGWIARRSGALGPAATRELNRLVVYLALPTLLFDIMATAPRDQVWQPGFILAFLLGNIIVFSITIWFRMRQGSLLADASIDGLNASYANTGFIGFPLVLAVIGEQGMVLTLIATILTACVHFAMAIVLIECSLQSSARRRDIAWKTLRALAKNPLVIAPVLGAVVLLSGWTLPEPVERLTALLGGAAAPCALITLGVFLAGSGASKVKTKWSVASVLVFLKLIVQPALTWLIAGPLLGLSPLAVHIAVLLAALPTGAGPFMLAELHGREAALTGRVILITTVLSIVTLSVYLGFA